MTPASPRRLPSTARVPDRAHTTPKAYPRDGGAFTQERGFGHVPGQRWGGGYGGDAVHPAPDGPPSGRGFSGSDFGPARSAPTGYGTHGSDMGMGERLDDRGPHYGKGPKGYQRSDARIHEDVCEAIAQQGHIDATDVEVKVERGIVTLTGTVHERHDKRGLEQLVEHTLGVEDVHNQIRLARSVAAAKPETAEPVPELEKSKTLRS